MEAALADALLAQCPDSDTLLRAVCGSDSPAGALSAERAGALRFVLQRVVGSERRGESEARRLAWEAALAHCFPALLASCSAPAEERLRLVRAACGALRCCASLCGSSLAERLAREALESLEAGPAGRLRTEVAVELLAAVAPWLVEPALLERAVRGALAVLQQQEEAEEEDEDKTLLVAGRLLPAVGRNRAALAGVWEGLVLASEGAPQPVSRTLLALSALSEAVFPADAQQLGGDPTGEAPRLLDARLSSGFWKVVQRGLTDSDALCRKRARYLLKRAVDVSEKLQSECRCSLDPGNDDTAIGFLTQIGLKRALKALTDSCKPEDLTINYEKTKIMVFAKKPKQQKWTLEGHPIEQVKQFKYLGAIFHTSDSWEFHQKYATLEAQ